MSNNKKPNHKKIQYMHKVQSKMKPDQHSHTHAHTHSYSRNQKANKRHNREERSSRQKHLTSVKIIWRRQRTKQKKRKETETERNERTNETPKCIVHIASTSPVIASSGHTTTTATTWDEHTDEIQTDKRHTHTHTDQQKIIMNVGHKNSPKRARTQRNKRHVHAREHTHTDTPANTALTGQATTKWKMEYQSVWQGTVVQVQLNREHFEWRWKLPALQRFPLQKWIDFHWFDIILLEYYIIIIFF